MLKNFSKLLAILSLSKFFASCKIDLIPKIDTETQKAIKQIKKDYEEFAFIESCPQVHGCTQNIFFKKSLTEILISLFGLAINAPI